MTLVFLRQRPDLAPLVARWIWDEWRHLLMQQSLEEFAEWFRGSERGDALPTTMVLLAGEEPLGTVSLECADMEIRPDLSPWLASLYVPPQHRGRGYGRMLVEAAEAEARSLGVTQLFLYTPGHEAFYTALGWEFVEDCSYREEPVTIMSRRLE